MKRIFAIVFTAVICSFTNAQNVGIGTTTPNASAQLEVSSNTKGILIPRTSTTTRLTIPTVKGLLVYDTTTNSFWFANGTVWNQIGTGGASPWTVSGSNIYNSNTGNVGIGTSTGLIEKLSVKGNIFVTHVNPNDIVNGGNRAALNLHGSSSGAGVINFLEPDTTVGGTILYSTILNQLYLRIGANTNQLVLRSTGDVGVGTASPTERLDVLGNIRSRDTIIADDDLEAGDDIRAGDNISAGGNMVATGVVSAGSAVNSSGSLFVNGSSSLNGDVTTNGNITMNNSGAILQLKNGSNIDKGFVQLNGDDLRVGVNSSNSNGKFVIRTGGGDQFFVDNAGYVGLGVSGPGALSRLHIGTGLDASLSSNGYMMLGNITGTNLILDNNEIMVRGANGTTNTLIMQADGGAVRIGGTTVPAGYKFAIDGKMICEEVRVKLAANWPDYVFNNDYKLLPLPELKKFIEQNSHLPNIPKAAVIEKEGLEVGDMQKKMMEKIEELTLYILDLQKQIDGLKKKGDIN